MRATLTQILHSMMGMSRSVTLCIAYILSQFPGTTPTIALENIKKVREIADPNEGFMDQLWLYHSMNSPQNIDTEPKYQRWLFERSVKESIDCGQAPDNIRFEDEADPAEEIPSGLEIRCRKCSRTLATSKYLVPHKPKPPSATQEAQMATAPISSEQRSVPGAPSQCAHLFLDPLSWMRPELEQGKLDGRLQCPKCNSNVGKYAWQGMRCSCGKWVVPALTLSRSSVDEIARSQNVHVGGERSREGFGGKI